MIISLPVGIIQLLLIQASHTLAFTDLTLRSSFHTNVSPNTASRIYAVDPNDPYASVLEAYQRKSMKPEEPTFSLPESALATDVPSVDVTPIDTPPDSVGEKVDDIVQAIDNVASSTIDASNQATEAAAAISAPAAAIKASSVTKATAVAAAAAASASSDSVSSSSEKAPTLLQYINSAGSNVGTPQPHSAFSDDTKEKLILLKNNLIGLGGNVDTTALEEKTKNIAAAAKSVSAAKISAAGAVAGGVSSGIDFSLDEYNIQTLIDNLQIEKFGAWYVTALSLLYAVNQKEAGRLEAERKFEEELAMAKLKADEAANAAVLAAEGAKAAKELVEMIPKMEEENVGEVLLEKSKIRQLEVEKEIMLAELEKIKLSNASQMADVSNLSGQKNGSVMKEKPLKIEIPVGKSTMERDPSEDKKVLDILKDLDDENAKVQAAAAKAKKAVKKKSVKKKAAKKKTRAPKKATVTAEVPVVKKKAVKKKAAKKKTRAPKKSPVIAVVPKESITTDEALKAIEAAEESFNEAMSESSKEAAMIEEIKGIVADAEIAVPAPKKKSSSPEPSPVPASSENPWGKLKESTLKRKTIAQLSAYLNERDVSIDGLSKTELVGAIQSL